MPVIDYFSKLAHLAEMGTYLSYPAPNDSVLQSYPFK